MSEPITLRPRENDNQQNTCSYCRELLQNSVHSCPSCQVSLHQDCRRELGRCPTIGCAANESWRADERRIALEALLENQAEAPPLTSTELTLKLLKLGFLAIPLLIWSSAVVLYGAATILYTIGQFILKGPSAEQLLPVFISILSAAIFIPAGLAALELTIHLISEIYPKANSPISPNSNRNASQAKLE